MRICAVCGKEYEQKAENQKYCSEECKKKRYKAKYGMVANARDWANIREFCMERDGYKCIKCGSRINLHCHHKLPFGNPYRQEFQHIVTVCEKCHIELHREVV